jgi:AraC family transcriptional regulator of adaptative response/methylated-DNA-[protein]-cysteine methyltransferase
LSRSRGVFRDGPLSFRPPEEFAYGTGKCALGAILVASGDNGIVSIIIGKRVAALVQELKSRFPKATIVRRERECKPMVGEVLAYVAAPFGCFPLALDMRGTPFQQRVWREVQKIPAGDTSSYTRIAEAIGAPKAIRAVANSCSRCLFAFAVPCHRVLHKPAADPAKRYPNDARRLRWVAYETQRLTR